MDCPTNINNGYNNVLFKLGLLDKNSTHLNKDRATLFYGVCIPIRTLIAIGVFCLVYIDNKLVQTILSWIIALFYLLSLIHLASKSEESKRCQWWPNTLEMILAIISLVICIYCIYKQISCVVYISLILILSILSGLIQSFIIQPFK